LVHGGVNTAAALSQGGGAVGAGSRPSPVQGFGRFEFAQSLYFNDTSTFKKLWFTDTLTLTQSAPFRVCLVNQGPSPLRATLAWSDDALTPGAGVALINDLDLLVYEHATGKSWRGNNAPGFDHANTVEHVEVPAQAGGTYVVMAYGTNVQRVLGFSLVLTGDFATEECATASPPITNCANGCSAFTNDCQEGLCLCNDPTVVGPDCTMINCASGCGTNGECDYTLGKCVCIQGQFGNGCSMTYTSLVPIEVDQTVSVNSSRGKAVGLFAGLFVFIYFLGCVLAAVCGIVCGQKFLEWRRDRAAER